MSRFTAPAALLLSSLVWGATPLLAQAKTAFTQKSICNQNTGLVDKRDLLWVVLKLLEQESKADFKKAFSEDGTTVNRHYAAERMRTTLQLFRTAFLKNTDNGFYRLQRPASADLLPPENLILKPQSYDIKCVPQEPSAGSALRERLDGFTKKLVSEHKLIAGKDLDSLGKELSARSPAKFSIARDQVADNTTLQAEFALAANLAHSVAVNSGLHTGGDDHTVFLRLQPFITSLNTGSSNSKDVDKTTVGVMFGVESVPFFGIGTNHFSVRAGFQTDTGKDYEAIVGEVAWWPQFGIFRALRLGETILIGGEDGFGFRQDLSGRFRTGDIRENFHVPTLPKEGSFARAGFKYELTAAFGGTDILANLSTTLSYLYLENLYGGNGIDQLQKLSIELNYKLTENYGFGISYTRGRDEDLLKKVDQVMAAFTVKFGDKLNPAAP